MAKSLFCGVQQQTICKGVIEIVYLLELGEYHAIK